MSDLSVFSIAHRVGLGVLDGDGGHSEVTHSFLAELVDAETKRVNTSDMIVPRMILSDSEEHKDMEVSTHRALGNNIAEEFLVNNPSIPLLLEVEAKQHPHLRLIGLVLWIHLKQTRTLLIDLENEASPDFNCL